jgi:hypothetical protein
MDMHRGNEQSIPPGTPVDVFSRFSPTQLLGESESVAALNREGMLGWEAVGMVALEDGTVAVLLKRPTEDEARR